MSLEELMNIRVTSVFKTAELLSEAPAAVHVITGDEIRRSGATTLADALRYVPGLQVARVTSHWWVVSSRGLAGNFSNKLLVLVDGRTAYTPMFAGVYWDAQSALPYDIDRIEVIRGPGATLWGANAVNGVINIITKNARETPGSFFRGAIGDKEQGYAAFRHGEIIGENTHLRLFGSYLDRAPFLGESGGSGADDWRSATGGFRADWGSPEKRSFTLQGDAVDGHGGATYTFATLTEPYMDIRSDTTRIRGANALFRWTEIRSPRSQTALQLYFDRIDRHDIRFGEERNTFDLDFHHNWKAADRMKLVWGTGYRWTSDRIDSMPGTYVIPEERTDDVWSGFLQGDMELWEDRFFLTLGSKFEENDYTGFEVQPSVRIRWFPHRNHLAWASASRAVRTPSRIEHDVMVDYRTIPPHSDDNPSSYPVVVALFGNDEFESEELLAYEAGYRARPFDRLSVDLAAFYNNYDNLRLLRAGDVIFQGTPVSWVRQPLYAINGTRGESYGIETSFDWRPERRLRFRAGYSYLNLDLRIMSGMEGVEYEGAEGASPDHQAFLQTSIDLPRDVEFDLGARYVDRLPAFDLGSYFTLDGRVAWSVSENVELSLVGQNLIEPSHAEFPQELVPGTVRVERGVYGSLVLEY